MRDTPLELVARVVDARLLGDGARPVRGASVDSRVIRPGDLFFALSGERTDGHRFVAAALEKGAVAAVVERSRGLRPGIGQALLEVDDPPAALGRLAAWWRSRLSARIVAVTGSVGKTTTKDLLAGALGAAGRTWKSPGNLNTEIGLPLALLGLEPEHRFGVFELSMRGPGQIAMLARILRPVAAVITNVGLSHLEVMGTPEAIAAAKAEVLDYLPWGGLAALPGAGPFADFLQGRVPEGVERRLFGHKPMDSPGMECDYGGAAMAPGTRAIAGRVVMRERANGPGVRCTIPLPGRHNALNATAAAAVARGLGLSWNAIRAGLRAAPISAMRMEVQALPNGGTLLNDAYNASSPETMIGALSVLRELNGRRRIAVLGDMLELGPASESAHREVGVAAGRAAPDLLVTVGSRAALLADAAQGAGMPAEAIHRCGANPEVIDLLQRSLRAGDLVLIKGSRGMAMEEIARGLAGSGASPS